MQKTFFDSALQGLLCVYTMLMDGSHWGGTRLLVPRGVPVTFCRRYSIGRPSPCLALAKVGVGVRVRVGMEDMGAGSLISEVKRCFLLELSLLPYCCSFPLTLTLGKHGRFTSNPFPSRKIELN